VRLTWLALVATLLPASAGADRPLRDYRWFRALSIDLSGRMPTRAEVEALGRPDFDLDGWIEAHLVGPAYAERMRRVYMDLLRLELGPSFAFTPPSATLRRETVLGPDRRELYVYYRRGQRRRDPATDGDFCLTAAETGLTLTPNGPPIGTATPLTAAVLEARTVAVKPWWLYADATAAVPADRFGDGWSQRFPGFTPVPGLLVEPDGKTATTEVRVCREEAQTAEFAAVYASGRAPIPPRTAPPAGRRAAAPADSGYAKSHAGRLIACGSGSAFQVSVDCGCGPALERCLPSAGGQQDPPAFVLPTHTPLGADQPFELGPQPVSSWSRFWWGQEAVRFLDAVFLDDRDVREILTSPATLVNGPLAQFYRSVAPATCCGPGVDLDYTAAEPLVDPARLPPLAPMDTATWLRVADRGPRASGILTMPIFLAKYGSRRARAHVLYNTFLCRDFVADSVKLEPSTEPDLRVRPGCSTCHATLEPLAAAFTRVAESDWTWLPASVYPLRHPRCAAKSPPGFCKSVYDPAFGELRGAHGSPASAERGPAGLAEDIVAAPEFPSCVVRQVAQSFLGRALDADDTPLVRDLTSTFVRGGYRMRALVRALVKSDAYRRGNDARGAP
jgi:hypothetical protein